MPEGRIYPACCTSAFCGKGPASCPACRFYPQLQQFKAWRAQTAAVQLDPIWSPTWWTSTRAGCTRSQPCNHCHTCGEVLRTVLDGEQWCDRCQKYRRYQAHGFERDED